MTSLPRFIDRAVGSYLRGQLDSGDATRTKRTLQEICKLYRSGSRFIPDQVIGIEISIVGLTFSSSDAKVRRWALNAMAQLGREQACKQAILHALQTYHDDAEVVAAAVAALYRQCPTAPEELRQLGFDEQMLTLAALQHVPPGKLDLSCLPLNVEHADAELIKLGLLVVGLNKAPPHMFDPDYDNAEIVRAVANHDEPVVSQYSVWAITENPNLGVKHLGIDLKNVEQQPSNVRAWIFQLLAMDSIRTTVHKDYIKLGIEDPSAEARLGLAIGLKNTFSTGLVGMVLEWFTREIDPEVSQQILDHIIRQSEGSDAYTQHALAAFERADGNAMARERMLATAAGTSLFSKLSQIRYNGGNDLFREHIVQKNTTINIGGNVQAGSFAIDGDASNTGTNTNTYNAPTLEVIQSRLSEAEHEIKQSVADPDAKKEALLQVEAARAEPTKDNLSKAVTAMDKVESLASKSLGVATAVRKIAGLIAQAAGLG